MHLICSSVHFLEHIGGVQIFIHIFINAEVACVLRQPGAVNGHALKSQPSDCITLHCNAINMQDSAMHAATARQGPHRTG